MRLNLGNFAHRRGGPLYESVMARARKGRLAGATVLHGPLGFGRHSRLHAARLAATSSNLPVVIELVDSREAIDRFMAEVDALLGEGLVPLEDVRTVEYGPPGA